ncbi:YiiX/YebB-like N1pC/P60 family cysteine hydrolase [Halothiobacillus sp.]|uniref:YiiX/YebB-like N1pC/P60 family cysteine hydrolase n=1 Tax=Halothiobacillus sp. TaxID=1891311 RepID=UPI002601D773|nr:YiiX/YebB-like N1pC/P60 family cysteine hydrolase [Halothiobacillus sp.]
MGTALSLLGRKLAATLTRPQHIHSAEPVSTPTRLLACLQPGDVLLVEGNSRVSAAIKFLTQSTWSHAAIYVGDYLAQAGGNPAHCFIEADMVEGVRSVGIEGFANLNTRVCRPFGLSAADCRQVAEFAIRRIGDQYDLRNVLDLARYFLPNPPVPARFRRRMLSLGSGDPTRAICSTLIAQTFQSVRYPILPIVSTRSADSPDCPGCIEEIYKIRHHSLFTPKDFDVSPYFQIIKPAQVSGFNFRDFKWEDIAS